MTTTTLRKGDVVRWCDPHEEFRVERVFEDGRAGIRPLSAPSGSYLHTVATCELTLLRRPVQVGDVLRARLYRVVPYQVISVDKDGFNIQWARWSWSVTPRPDEYWEHADGTPISPPESDGSAGGQADRPIRTAETLPRLATHDAREARRACRESRLTGRDEP